VVKHDANISPRGMLRFRGSRLGRPSSRSA
jgi:hypothetical protein